MSMIELTFVTSNCIQSTYSNPFDGDSALAYCKDTISRIDVAARCANNVTELFIYTGKYMLSSLRLRTALDGVETPAWAWSMADTHESLFIHPAIPTIKQMLEHSRFHVRIVESDGDTHHADIDISGLGEAIKPVREACQW